MTRKANLSRTTVFLVMMLTAAGLFLCRASFAVSQPSTHDGTASLTTDHSVAESAHPSSGAPAGHTGEKSDDRGHGEGGHGLGSRLPLWSAVPFVGILLSIAILPLVAPSFWHHHFGKVSAAWAALLALPFVFAYGGEGFQEILHIYVIDYIPFIILLWGLFTAAGGIVVRGTLRGTPAVNTLMLAIGTALASWIGTTGAAMLLIRPVIRANKHRPSQVHVIVFFIFLVANIGGSLTPLGDPPLFLGFLHQVPFFWTTANLFPQMSLVAVLLLLFFFGLDTLLAKREKSHAAPPTEDRVAFGVDGLHNIIFLGGIVAGVLMSGTVKLPAVHLYGHVEVELQNLLRDGMIVIMGLLSWVTTRKELREANGFTWFPIKEVAYLFAGIFMTIVPALAILRAGEHGALAGLIRSVNEPWHYFWITGSLSSFLDNAPTYLTFFNTALGKLGATEADVRAMLGYVAGADMNLAFVQALTAISCGAVFMGANTYIGNAPNFMVKSIAEENGIPMPSFFGYMAWSMAILLPLFMLTTLVFFR